MKKIRYRLCFNYSGRLNNDGMAPVALECRQDGKKMYMTSGVTLYPNQWKNGMVVNHENANKLTAYLIHWRNSIEDIELSALLNDRQMTLSQLKVAVKTGVRQKATLREFTAAVIDGDSSRCENTKRSYHYLCNELEKQYGTLTLTDITYDLIIRYREAQRKKGLSENTIKGRLKALRCLLEEAHKRDIIDKNPFDNIVIGNISAKRKHLTENELKRLRKVNLNGKEAHIRDAFIFCCMTGLRFSDFTNLKTENVKNDTITITQQKTSGMVRIPLKPLFNGEALRILKLYQSVEAFADIGHNTTANKALKAIAVKAGIKKNLHWHLSRHTAGTLLNLYGLKMQEIQQILGHARMETTSAHYAETTTRQLEKSLKKAFK